MQFPPALNPFMMNPYLQHFCSTRIIAIKSIEETIFKNTTDQSEHVLEFQSQTLYEQLTKKESQLSTKAAVKFGSVTASVGINELIVIAQLT